MKKNAFTLIELLAIIIILGAIALISIPSLSNMIKNNQEKKYEQFLDDIYMSTENYISTHIDEYPSLNIVGGTETISLKELIENDYISSDLKNPRTGNVISKKDTIIITKNEDKTFNFEYIEGEL